MGFMNEPVPSLQHALGRTHALASVINSSTSLMDESRRLPDALVEALAQAGLFRLLLPAHLSGAALAPWDFVEVIEALASHDASTAWCVAQACSCSMIAPALDREVARTVFATDRDLVAWGPAARDGHATDLGDGYRVSGSWMFASGRHHATWLGGHCRVVERDGSPRLDDAGHPIIRTMLFPASAATFDDAWNVIGLRGTGSDSYVVSDIIVPHGFCVDRERPSGSAEDGPLYRLTMNQISAIGFAAVALGIARGALDACRAMAVDKVPRAEKRRLSESAVFQAEMALAQAKLRSARAFLLETVHSLWPTLSEANGLSLAHAADLRLASTYSIHMAVEVVQFAYRAGGSSTIFAGHPLERRFRDINTVAQQIQARHSHFETVGQVLFGLEADTTLF